ncbi:hypothetical protein FPV67DRAFT_1664053 [Lyophyllum atratum]|nr:hypothetical protein FPV67DRAFT_1664053 [Lyophyllum atratum]
MDPVIRRPLLTLVLLIGARLLAETTGPIILMCPSRPTTSRATPTSYPYTVTARSTTPASAPLLVADFNER